MVSVAETTGKGSAIGAPATGAEKITARSTRVTVSGRSKNRLDRNKSVRADDKHFENRESDNMVT
jgi:hypothetical protein